MARCWLSCCCVAFLHVFLHLKAKPDFHFQLTFGWSIYKMCQHSISAHATAAAEEDLLTWCLISAQAYPTIIWFNLLIEILSMQEKCPNKKSFYLFLPRLPCVLHLLRRLAEMEEGTSCFFAFECVWKHVKSVWKCMKVYEKHMKAYKSVEKCIWQCWKGYKSL